MGPVDCLEEEEEEEEEGVLEVGVLEEEEVGEVGQVARVRGLRQGPCPRLAPPFGPALPLPLPPLPLPLPALDPQGCPAVRELGAPALQLPCPLQGMATRA